MSGGSTSFIRCKEGVANYNRRTTMRNASGSSLRRSCLMLNCSWACRKSFMSGNRIVAKKTPVIAIGCLCLVCVVSCGGFSPLLLSFFIGPRSLLPYAATEIREFRESDNNLPFDCIYLLSAKLPEEDFAEYVSRLGLVPLEERRDYRGWTYSWDGYDADSRDWWRPSASLKNTFVLPRHRSSTIIMLKYEFGRVFYLETHGI